MSHGSTAFHPAASNDLWRVQLPTGELRAMDLDALDAAFQDGAIDEHTPVLAPGSLTWTKLADAAGLEAAPETAAVPSLSPMAADVPLGPPSVAPSSVAPVSADLAGEILAKHQDLDLSDDAFKTSKAKLFGFVFVGLAAVVGLVFGGAKLAGQVEGGAAASAMRAQAVAAPQAPVDVMDVDARARALSEDQKRRLLEADKLREASAKAKAAAAPAPRAGHAAPRSKDKTPFVQGGDKFDPLNGAL